MHQNKPQQYTFNPLSTHIQPTVKSGSFLYRSEALPAKESRKVHYIRQTETVRQMNKTILGKC